jgi:hypothetical protein
MAQMLGGVLAARIRGLFHHRGSALIAMAGGSAITIAAIGLADTTGLPQRHDPVTAASHDPLVRLADEPRRRGLEPAGARPGRRRLGGYAPSYAMSAGIAALGLPFLALSRRRTY